MRSNYPSSQGPREQSKSDSSSPWHCIWSNTWMYFPLPLLLNPMFCSLRPKVNPIIRHMTWGTWCPILPCSWSQMYPMVPVVSTTGCPNVETEAKPSWMGFSRRSVKGNPGPHSITARESHCKTSPFGCNYSWTKEQVCNVLVFFLLYNACSVLPLIMYVALEKERARK